MDLCKIIPEEVTFCSFYTIMISFGIWNTKIDLINHEIKNCTFLSPFQGGKPQVLSWFWTTDLGSVIGQEMS